MKIRQVYYCVTARPICKQHKKLVYSWLTPEEAKRLVDPVGIKCPTCKAPLKWIRSEPLMSQYQRP